MVYGIVLAILEGYMTCTFGLGIGFSVRFRIYGYLWVQYVCKIYLQLKVKLMNINQHKPRGNTKTWASPTVGHSPTHSNDAGWDKPWPISESSFTLVRDNLSKILVLFPTGWFAYGVFFPPTLHGYCKWWQMLDQASRFIRSKIWDSYECIYGGVNR